MKNIVFQGKNGMKSSKMLAAALTFGFFMLFLGQMSAQSASWVTPSEGTAIANQQLTITLNQLQGLTPGTQQYEESYRKALYFKGVITNLGNGLTVEQSANAATTPAYDWNTENDPGVNQAAMQMVGNIRRNAVTMLTN